jgi:hypothetical protein
MERTDSLALREGRDDLIRHYNFTESDLSYYPAASRSASRLGFAAQLCYMRYPGVMLPYGSFPGLTCFKVRVLW